MLFAVIKVRKIIKIIKIDNEINPAFYLLHRKEPISMFKRILDGTIICAIIIFLIFQLITNTSEFVIRLSTFYLLLGTGALLLFISYAVHKLGHLAFGLLSGYQFDHFRIFCFLWYKKDARVGFKISWNAMHGHNLKTPAKSVEAFKFVLYYLGGGIFSFLLCLLLIFLIYIVPSNTTISDALGLGLLINLVMGISDLVPSKLLFDEPTGMSYVLAALKSKDATRGLYIKHTINDILLKDKRFSDFDENVFAVEEKANLNNFLVAYLAIHEAARLNDLGQFNASAEILQRLNLRKLPRLYRYEVLSLLLFHYIVHNPDLGKARDIYKKNKKFRKALKENPDGYAHRRALAAYLFFVEENKKEGIELMETAKKNLENMAADAAVPQRGLLMEIEPTQKLEKKMRETHSDELDFGDEGDETFDS